MSEPVKDEVDAISKDNETTINEEEQDEGGDVVMAGVEDQEDEGDTRCICGEMDPPDESGLYIQCETCGVWQHGFCVGINEGDDSTLDKYWCEQCKPELHRLYTLETGELRSNYIPVQNKRKKSERKKRSDRSRINKSPGDSNSSAGNVTNEIDEELSVLSNSRTRSANDADINNDFSNNDDVPVNHDIQNSSDYKKINERFEENEGNDKSDESYKGDGTDVKEQKDIIEDDTNFVNDSKRTQDRKRATLSAREEKQYQLMLEKAIKESRRTSNSNKNDSDEEALEDDIKIEAASDEKSQELDGKASQFIAPTNGNVEYLKSNDNTLQPDSQTNDSQVELEYEKTGSKRNVSSRIDVASSDDTDSRNNLSDSSIRSKNRSARRGDGRKAQNLIKKTGRRSGRSSSTNLETSASKSEPDITKPVKPRLPPQRTSMNEMKRRVAAILEFISRTQWELSQEQQSKDDLVRFVENQQFIQQVDSIYKNNDESLKLMDDLTRELLVWSKKYNDGLAFDD